MRRICIFAHFDKDNIIDEYVAQYIKGLSIVIKDIIFVSSCNINKTEKQKIYKYCKLILVKDNTGYDFGSWKFGIEYIGYNRLKKYDEVIIANDSCFGPIFPFTEMFNTMSSRQCDVWGVTYGVSYTGYLQSYFIVFKKNIINSYAFIDFIKSIRPQKDKYSYIIKYEIGLTKMLNKNSFIIDYYCKVGSILQEKKTLIQIIKSFLSISIWIKILKQLKMYVFNTDPFGRLNLYLKFKSAISETSNPCLFNALDLIKVRCLLIKKMIYDRKLLSIILSKKHQDMIDYQLISNLIKTYNNYNFNIIKDILILF